MDKEKLLKKWQIVTVSEWLFLTIWYFIVLYCIACKPEFAYNLMNRSMWFVVLFVVAFLFNKIKPEKRRIMPMIISIHDTVEKLKKQRIILCIIAFLLCFISHSAIRSSNIILIAIGSTWIPVVFASNLVKDKIDYLKEKPEGL